MNSQIPELHQKKVSKKSFSFVACDRSTCSVPLRLEPGRYSNWRHYVRVYAYVCTFIGKYHSEESHRTTDRLQASEVDDTELKI